MFRARDEALGWEGGLSVVHTCIIHPGQYPECSGCGTQMCRPDRDSNLGDQCYSLLRFRQTRQPRLHPGNPGLQRKSSRRTPNPLARLALSAELEAIEPLHSYSLSFLVTCCCCVIHLYITFCGCILCYT